MGMTYTTSRTSRKKGELRTKYMQRSHFRINSPLRISHTHRPQRIYTPEKNFSPGVITVRPAQLVVPVAKEYRSRV